HAGSFRDDPTRVFRLARFVVRLSLQPVDATLAALADIVATGFEALTTVGGDRLRAEWGRVCSEPDPFAVVRWLSENKVPQALGFSGDSPALEAVGRMFALRGQGRTVAPSDVLMCWWLAGRMSLSAQESDVALEAFGLQEHRGSWLMQHQAIGRAQQDLAAQVTDDVLEQCLAALDEPTRGALVALHPQTAGAVKRYESVVSAIAPLVDGALLLAAGMVEGPAVGQALTKVRIAQLRGQLRSTDDALDFLGLSTP
ncbi:MAG TPA: hypothetical protein DIU15_13795, partial [Deltaproteobacteria bacterium]|nr:hypothetical protein [Deltaproteobacteria bacterium]